MSLGKYIAQRRRKMHLTQEQLAEILHVSKSAVGKWESDRGIPDRENLRSLSEVMNVSLDILYRIVDGEDPVVSEINITEDVIALLQLYGYKVTREK